jgi:predicted nucleotidyltransferase
MNNHRLGVSPEKLAAFCYKWKIIEMSLFGSVLREDFRPDSDVDVLVSFAPECRLNYPTSLDVAQISWI